MNVRKYLKQYAVYWPPGAAGETGQQAFGDPVEIRCRWEDRQEVQVEANTNLSWTSKSVILVDRTLEEGGILWKGRFNRLTSRTEPFANPKASAIRKYSEIPDRNATDRGTLRTAIL